MQPIDLVVVQTIPDCGSRKCCHRPNISLTLHLLTVAIFHSVQLIFGYEPTCSLRITTVNSTETEPKPAGTLGSKPQDPTSASRFTPDPPDQPARNPEPEERHSRKDRNNDQIAPHPKGYPCEQRRHQRLLKVVGLGETLLKTRSHAVVRCSLPSSSHGCPQRQQR